jgi:AraC-like DNA-binding protein
VLYLERIPAAPLTRCVRTLWYASAADFPHRRERMLPTGCVQIILNLARDFLLDCGDGEADQRVPAALIVGARSVFEIVDNSDMACLIGIVFEPGGFSCFANDSVHRFSNCSVALEDVWGRDAHRLRDRLRELPTAHHRLGCLEAFLRQRFAERLRRQSMVDYALDRFAHGPGMASVKEVARATGWSERRFSQVFREQVGFSPKVWCRIQRFQRAVKRLHAGFDLPWAELALDCGFYDQSHFANEFRAFSGIDATTYSARRTVWANHIPVE